MLRAIGIDLGTSKAAVSTLQRGEAVAVFGRERSPLVPSLLGFGPAGRLLLGQEARTLGGEAAVHVGSLFRPEAGRLPRTPRSRRHTPVDLVALFLAQLRQGAEAALGEPVRRAVLTAPVSAGQAQLAVLHEAAALAGLYTLAIIPAPLAFLLAYAIEHPQSPHRLVLVFDLGAGGLDVTVARLFHGAMTVLGLAGEDWLGGEDLTDTIVAALLRRLQAERRLPLDESQAARRRLRRRLHLVAEEAKVALSTVDRVTIPLTRKTTGFAVNLSETVTQGEYEALIRPRLDEALEVCNRALLAAGLARERIDGILLAGGSSRIPFVQNLLAQHFPNAHLLRDVNPLLGAAMGAALMTGLLPEVPCPACGRRNPIERLACAGCGTALAGEERVTCPRCFLLNDARRRACRGCGGSLRGALLQSTRAHPAHHTCCPRCGVPMPHSRATCAACHAPLGEPQPTGLRCPHCTEVLPAGSYACPACGELAGPFVGNISRRALGIEGEDGRLDVILPRGQSIPSPCSVYREFCTDSLGGQSLQVPIYEGDRPRARDNPVCAHLRLSLPKGLPAQSIVRVGFALGRDGLLQAVAELSNAPCEHIEVELARS